MEVYESHLGGIFFSDEVIDPELLYCEQCGDSDWHLGHADKWEDVVDMITDEDGWCMYPQNLINSWKEYFEEMVGEE